MVGMSKELIKLLIKNKYLLTKGNFLLSSGGDSTFYFDCKKATLNGYFLHLLTEYILDEIIPTLPEEPSAVGGLTLGADFMTAALILKSYEKGLKMRHGSIVRKEPKKHGTKNCIENVLEKGTTILVVDDVVTSGKSIEKACKEFEEAGYKIIAILTIVDRSAGRLESFIKNKYNSLLISMFTENDFS